MTSDMKNSPEYADQQVFLSPLKAVNSIRDCAIALGRSEFTIREWVRLGLLDAHHQGRRVWITAPAIKRFLDGGAE